MIILSSKLLQNSLNKKWKPVHSMQVFTYLENCFHLLLFCKLWLWSMQNHARHCFQAFACSHDESSEVTVLFDWNLSRLPFLGYVVNLDLLICTGFIRNVLICSSALFLLRDKCDCKLLQNFISHKKICSHCPLFLGHCWWLVTIVGEMSLPKIYKPLKPFWLLN